MTEWTFITNHAALLAYLAKHPRTTARELATVICMTERSVHKIISDLEQDGYIKRQKAGRNNVYTINPNLSLRHPTARDVRVLDLLKVLGWRKRREPARQRVDSPELNPN